MKTFKENNHQRKFEIIFLWLSRFITKGNKKKRSFKFKFFLNVKVITHTHIQTQYGNTIYSAHENGNV